MANNDIIIKLQEGETEKLRLKHSQQRTFQLLYRKNTNGGKIDHARKKAI
jgi:hypothetical protein